MVSEALRSQLCGLPHPPSWCRHRSGGREGRRHQVPEEGREREFPVLNLVSSDRGADSMFLFCFVLFSSSGISQSMSVWRRQGISPKQREFRQLLGNIP